MPLAARADAAPRATAVLSWPIWIAVAATTATLLGIEWDIAWHRSIGRDSFWSPPHVAIYLGGILAALSSVYLIFSTTFGGSQAARAASVRVWGFRGPLGAFTAAWGGVAMIASAPFDDWWHNAYGLDVRILSPPHTLLAIGIFCVCLGSLLLVGAARNRSPERAAPRVLFLYLSGLILSLVLTFVMEYTSRAVLHSATPYRVLALGVPLVLIGFGRASGSRWGATAIAGVYSAVYLALLWLFPFVPATPKLGPVYVQVTHLIPPGFPLAVIVPALLIDLADARLKDRSPWLRAFAAGAIYFVSFLVAEWNLASFLITPAAENWFFGSGYHDYNSRRTWAEFRHAFHPLEPTRLLFFYQLGLGFAVSLISARLALWWADALGKLRR
ncbi:MAG TPA: hypothetical protein VFF06_12930 [Polyangia bacterium]|nr:hypothetical protein [Polyangia bacterium]